MPTGIRYRYAVIVLSFSVRPEVGVLLVQGGNAGVPIFGLRASPVVDRVLRPFAISEMALNAIFTDCFGSLLISASPTTGEPAPYQQRPARHV